MTEVYSRQRKLAPDVVGSDKRKQTSLLGIANKAKTNRQHRFRDLYRILNAEYLLHCFGTLNKNAASGIDKISWREYEENLHANIDLLVDKLKSKKYKAKLIRRSYIPKANGKQRPLGIPAIEDKLLQTAVAKILEAIYEQDFLPCSYGYRSDRSAKDAVRDITFDLQYGKFGYIVEADIKAFFDNMDHDWLITMLKLRIDDKAFLRLIQKWLKAGVLDTDGYVTHPDTGSPQGSPVSPVLANVYLHYALDLFFEKVQKPKSYGEALICRYCDDFVCAFRFKDDAERFYCALPERLKKFNLVVASEKTHILRFSRFNPTIKNRFTFLGFEFFWNKDRKGVPRVIRRTDRRRLRSACQRIKGWIKTNRHLPCMEFFKGLNIRLKGHYNYYGVIGNARSICRFYNWATICTFKWLNRRGGKKKSFNWEQFQTFMLKVIVKPKITEVKCRRVFA